MQPVSPLLAVHIAAGALAVPLGAAALVAQKGGQRHARFGKLYYLAMTVVVGSAAALTAALFEPYLAGLTAAAAVGTFSGCRVLKRKRPDLDPTQRAAAADWALAVAALATGLLLIGLAAAGVEMRNTPVLYSLAGTCTLYGLYDLRRFSSPGGWPFSPRLWLYEHIVKVLGGYFGAVAALSGNVLVYPPDPWRQLWAPIFGEVLTLYFLVRYRARGRALVLGAPAPSGH
jgi:hypothetical protein